LKGWCEKVRVQGPKGDTRVAESYKQKAASQPPSILASQHKRIEGRVLFSNLIGVNATIELESGKYGIMVIG